MSPGDHYAALGSSFAAGPGIEPIIDTAAGRSGANYPHLVAERLGLDLTDVTRSGAVTDDLLETGRSRWRFWRRIPPQLAAIRPHTRLVTLTVGGNDLGYIGGLIKATALSGAPGLVRRIVPTPGLGVDPQRVRALESRLAEVVSRIREQAPEARVLLVEYLSVIDPDHPEGTPLPLTGPQRRAGAELAHTLTGVYAEVATRTGAEVVETACPSAAHAVGSTDPWVTGYGGLHGGVVPYHPIAAGMAAAADLIIGQLQSSTPDSGG